ncbi:peroxisomal 2,4-dienoyl-CoA reductase [(3E)-enoyl-CoA-producing] isoform X1 [Phyllobates terribilis]|uniref:peroxisomal 2,4-dienoyl-CoA reductase [(3E)-enoyl-CoA-producing] isoform X1 n=1 Tax=Phyllobates terribilis TaxID=111132 RepID=UPI003CCAB76B
MSTLPPPDQPPEDVASDDCLPSYSHLYSPTLLQGRVAFITGGGSGIGFRIAEIFMRHGCDTIIVSRNMQRVTEAAAKLRGATGRHCLPLTADVRQPQTLTDAVEEALRTFSRIDILVNNAAGNFLCPASSLSFNAFKNVLDIDTMGTFNASKILFERYFRDHGGVILNITATLGYKGNVLQVHAGSAKAAIDAMTKHLAVEWGPSKVRVNGIAPGPIGGTEGMRRLGGAAAEAMGVWDTIPLQRLGNKTEVAHGALFLVSPLASYVTGTTLVMDGGSWMTSPNHMASVLDRWSSEMKKSK